MMKWFKKLKIPARKGTVEGLKIGALVAAVLDLMSINVSYEEIATVGAAIGIIAGIIRGTVNYLKHK